MEKEINQFNILIVDDSDFSRSAIAKMLDEPRFKIVGEASSAKEAISILSDRKVHIAIIDIVMPEVSGLELAETISKTFSSLYIIIISSLAQENIVIEAISAGANDFIQKPFGKDDLMASMDKIIQNIQQE